MSTAQAKPKAPRAAKKTAKKTAARAASPRTRRSTGPAPRRGILHEEQTRFQTIQLRRDANGLFLRLNGQPQVHSREERRYHDCIATMPLLLAANIRKVAILGGGDGLAARNILEFPGVKQATLVELDGGMIELCSREPEWAALNGGALVNPRLNVVVDDAIGWFLRQRGSFDVIIHDLEMTWTDQPDALTPDRVMEFFFATYAKLSPGGVWVLTVPDDTPPDLADGAFAANAAGLPNKTVAAYKRARSTAAKIRVLLKQFFGNVREWTIKFPILGPHTTFYISNAPLKKLQREAPEQFTVKNALKKLK
jgi:hypothetical protein